MRTIRQYDLLFCALLLSVYIEQHTWGTLAYHLRRHELVKVVFHDFIISESVF